MDDLDKKIREILSKAFPTGASEKKKNCPEESILVNYTDDLLEETQREQLEQHLIECNHCLELVLFNSKVQLDESDEEVPDAPDTWKRSAMNLISEKADVKEGLFDIVLRFLKEKIEVADNPGNLSIFFEPAPMPARAGRKELSENLITLKRIFADLESSIEVERVDDTYVNMKVITVNHKSGAPAIDLRISLFNPVREIASYVVEDGMALFMGLKYGRYVIKINSGTKRIGEISLDLRT